MSDYDTLDKAMRKAARANTRQDFIHAHWYNLWISGLLTMVAAFFMGSIWFSRMPLAVKCLLSAIVTATAGTAGVITLGALNGPHSDVSAKKRRAQRD